MTLVELPESVLRLFESIAAGGGRPILVGGAVRDALLLERRPKDLDVEVFGLDAESLAGIAAERGRVLAVGRSFGVLKLLLPEGDEIDLSLPRRESKRGRGHKGFLVEPDPTMTFAEAASRRDFTINAMGYDALSDELLDPHGGRRDLDERVLRHVGPAFAEDPLRVLRGMQLAGRFALEADPATVELSAGLLDEYDTLAPERIWAEWSKWAERSRRPSLGLTFLRRSGWWRRTPELVALAGCPQDAEWHPEGDVYEHTLLVCDAAARIAEREVLEPRERAVLLFAALTHDLGKPDTTFEDEAGRIRSPGHAERVDLVESFLTRVGAPRPLIDRVSALCRWHLAHIDFQGSRRHVRRLARALGEKGETIGMLALVAEADGSGRPPLPGGMPEPMRQMLELARELEAESQAPRPLLRGRDLIEAGHHPGPRMGEILDAAFEAQLDGSFETREEALAWVLERFEPGSGREDAAGE